MRKNNILVQLSLVFASVLLVACSSQSVKKTLKPSISSESIAEYINYLASDELEGRNTGSEGIDKAADFIQNTFENAEIPPFFETYRDSFQVGEVTGFNILGVIEGSDPALKKEYVLVGAHYDHIGKASPVEGDSIANGANDNASGTVGVLKLAEAFAENRQNKRSLIFALFSGEELGLRGSASLAQHLKEQGLDLYTMVNLEMIGVPMKAKTYEAYLTGYKESNMAQKMNKYAGMELVGFLPQAGQLNLFRRSDNYPFYQQFRIPAQTVSTFDFSNYDFYHHVDDEAPLMNTDHMANLLQDLYPAILEMTRTSEREIKMNE